MATSTKQIVTCQNIPPLIRGFFLGISPQMQEKKTLSRTIFVRVSIFVEHFSIAASYIFTVNVDSLACYTFVKILVIALS